MLLQSDAETANLAGETASDHFGGDGSSGLAEMGIRRIEVGRVVIIAKRFSQVDYMNAFSLDLRKHKVSQLIETGIGWNEPYETIHAGDVKQRQAPAPTFRSRLSPCA